MGWQQKGSMRLYNSLSGIGWLVGVMSKKICDVLAMCKACAICEVAQAKFTPVRKHDCHVNHTGSSKSMESESFGRMLLRAPQRGYFVGTVVADDDSGIRKGLGCKRTREYYQRDLKYQTSLQIQVTVSRCLVSIFTN